MKDWRNWPGSYWFFAASMVFLVVVVAWASLNDEGGGASGDEVLRVCHERVEAQLVSPGSADYSGENVYDQGDGHYRATGTVDADNSFGASLRSGYTCTAVNKDGAWGAVVVLS